MYINEQWIIDAAWDINEADRPSSDEDWDDDGSGAVYGRTGSF